jgi:D-arabinose 1-dehydrogenase-like Zn-dependent alcohol dehydrogenase
MRRRNEDDSFYVPPMIKDERLLEKLARVARQRCFGSAKTMQQAVQCLGVLGRAALVGLTAEAMSIFPYPELINKEVEIIGVSDHLASELPALIEFARTGKLCFPPKTLRIVDLDAGQISAALDELQHSIDHIRTVIRVTDDV